MRPTRTYTFHKYRCPQGHVSQLLVERANILKKQKCKQCGKKAEHTGLVAYREAMTPTVIAINKEGKKLYLGSKDDPIPKGYEKREILPSEIKAFEREVNRELYAEQARDRDISNALLSETISRNAAEIREMYGSASAFERDLAEYAISQARNRYTETPSPDFRVKAYE